MIRFNRLVTLVSAALLCLLPMTAVRAQDDFFSTKNKPAANAEAPPDKDKKWVPGMRMAKAVTRVLATGMKAGEKSKFAFDDSLCVLGAFLLDGKDIGFKRTLTAGKKYAIIGAADDNADDLNVYIKDKDDKTVASDTEEDAQPAVIFECKETGVYTVRLELKKANKASFCAMGFLTDGEGYHLKDEDVTSAAASWLSLCGVVDDATKGNAIFSANENQWALYGTILEQDESLEITNVKPGKGKCIFVAGGASESSNLDLFIKDGSGDVVGSNEKEDANPWIVRDAGEKDAYKLKIKNTKATGPTLIFASVLRQGG